MANQTEISLLNLFIFNSEFGPREGEEEKKILYYHPAETDIDSKIRHVGLCEAVTKFTQTFTTKDTESIHTQRTRQLFYQPEQDYWMVLVVSVPITERVKEDKKVIEHHEDSVQNSVYLAVLKQAYKMFRLFNGTFHNIVEKHGVDNLKYRFDYFFSKYLLTVRANQCDILDVFSGIHFLPLDNNTYLRIQCFINKLEAQFPQINHTVFLYNEQLVWSGLEQDEMRIMYQYLVTSLLPSVMETEFNRLSTASNPLPQPLKDKHYGRYILGPPNINDSSNLGKIPQIHVNLDTDPMQCHLLVYKALSASIVLLLKQTDSPIQFDLLKRLDTFLGPQMSALASDIGDQYSKKPSNSGDVQFKYIYFNHMNLAQKTTVHTDAKVSNIPPDVLRILADLNHDLNFMSPNEDAETIVKTGADWWVVFKQSDQREFYVVLNQKNANLIEINEEVKRLCSSHFSNIFFLD